MNKLIYILMMLFVFTSFCVSAQSECELVPSEANIKTTTKPPPEPVIEIGSLLPPPVPPNFDERIVGFVHGIGGGSNTWVSARNWTNEKYPRAITPSDLKYNMDNIKDAAYRIQEEMDRANNAHIFNTGGEYDESQSFIVAHSLGGLVARDMEYRTVHDDIGETEWQQQFGGLITFGTPHRGTNLVNNSDLALEVAEEGCRLAAHQKITQFIEENFSDLGVASNFTKNFLYSVTLESGDVAMGATVESLVCDDLLGFVVNAALSGMLPTIAKDMSPDSEILSKLNGHDFTYPLIACYGVEDDPVSLRQIAGTQNNIDEFEFGGADLVKEEEAAIDSFANYLASLEAGFDYYSELANPASNTVFDLIEDVAIFIGDVGAGAVVGALAGVVLSVVGIGSVLAIAKLGALIGAIWNWLSNSNSDPDYAAIAYAYLEYWLWCTLFDNNYRLVMGIDDVNATLIGYELNPNCTIDDYELPFDCNVPVEQMISQTLCEQVYCYDTERPIFDIEIIENASDGTVQAQSASQPTHANVFKTMEMPGSNHVQMKNDSNIDKILRGVYSEQDDFSYFRIEE